MSCHGNNATPPSPAVAPGVEQIDPAAFARELGRRHAHPSGQPCGIDPRVPALVPGFDAPFFQAGLAGYSDTAMRIIARRHGAPYCVTEALLDRMLLGGGHGFDKADLDLIRENCPGGEEDHPLAGQIIGSDPDEMAAAALKMIEQGARHDRAYRDLAYGENGMPTYIDTRWRTKDSDERRAASDEAKAHQADSSAAHSALSAQHSALSSSLIAHRSSLSFETIDVNLACPVKKIDRKARGGHWLAEPEGGIAILKAVREAVPAHIPCSVKLRRGYDDTPEMARSFEKLFDAAYELGYAWATVHARTVEQKYIGPSRWTFLRDLVARRPDRLIFGSGDVWEAADIFRMIAYTGVHAVSVARGCIGNPWIFRQARAMLAGEPALAPTIDEQRRVLIDHFRLAAALHGETLAGRTMRKFGIKFAHHHPRAEAVRQAMISVTSTASWESVVQAFYEQPVEMKACGTCAVK